MALCVSTFSIVVILFIKKWFGKQLTAKWRYHLWMFLLIMLLLPFIPTHIYSSSSLFDARGTDRMSTLHSNEELTRTNMVEGLKLIQDFSVSVNRLDLSFVSITVLVLWTLGVLLFTFNMILGWNTLRRIKKHSLVFANQEVLQLFEECKKRVGVKKSITMFRSKQIQSPMIVGQFKPYIMLPAQHENWLSLKHYEYIFLHELNHYKNNDLMINYVIVFYQIIYWFNPLIWFAFREMRLDREIACDESVLYLLDEHSFSAYGNTIINFIDSSKRSRKLHLVTKINGSKSQIKKRIERISVFKPSFKKTRSKNVLIYFVASLVMFVQLPVVSAFSTQNDRYYFDYDRAVNEDLQLHFEGYEGSFVLFDQNAQQYHFYNEEKSKLRVSPNSTYKIYSALFALEKEVIAPEESTLMWDGTKQPFEDWNKDQDVSSALQKSVNWYFKELDYRMGFDSIQSNLKNINYGNSDISGGLGEYWLESSLKISPIEQVQLLQAFYYNQLGYKDFHIQTVKESLLIEEKKDIRISGKTGTGAVNGKDINGWFVGYVETANNTYFFATNLQNEDQASGSKAVEMTLQILEELRIY
ncbi:BlaR1 family beta-lactam sensor/signal transducer [Alkalihalobacillus sp. NPDC127517]